MHRIRIIVDFIASLAVSDFLIGLFSMPLYTAYLLLDENWVLGSVVCNLWCAQLLPCNVFDRIYEYMYILGQ